MFTLLIFEEKRRFHLRCTKARFPPGQRFLENAQISEFQKILRTVSGNSSLDFRNVSAGSYQTAEGNKMKAAEMRPHIIETARGFVLAADAEKRNHLFQTLQIIIVPGAVEKVSIMNTDCMADEEFEFHLG